MDIQTLNHYARRHVDMLVGHEVTDAPVRRAVLEGLKGHIDARLAEMDERVKAKAAAALEAPSVDRLRAADEKPATEDRSQS